MPSGPRDPVASAVTVSGAVPEAGASVSTAGGYSRAPRSAYATGPVPTLAVAGSSMRASPRASIALFRTGQALAAIQGRDFVTPDDVKAMAGPALAHRLILKPELWAARISPAQVVEGLLAQVPAPGPEAR